MRIDTVKYQVYKFNELSKEAKEKAVQDYYEYEDFSFLQDDLTESCKSLLEQYKIKFNNDLQLSYSLSYCQGDGLNFTGNFEWKKYHIKIAHSSWQYLFASASDITIMNKEGEEIINEKIEKQFKNLYINICKDLEKEGYGIIGYRMTDKEFSDLCEANNWEFLKDGKIYN